jgi:hypothetical protein
MFVHERQQHCRISSSKRFAMQQHLGVRRVLNMEIMLITIEDRVNETNLFAGPWVSLSILSSLRVEETRIPARSCHMAPTNSDALVWLPYNLFAFLGHHCGYTAFMEAPCHNILPSHDYGEEESSRITTILS